MIRTIGRIFFWAAFGGIFFCGPTAQTFGQDYIGAARGFLQAAQEAWNSAQQFCQSSDCNSDLVSQLGSLSGDISRLAELLGQERPDINQVRATIDGMSGRVQDVCNRIGGTCAAVPAGGPTAPAPARSDPAPGGFVDCESCRRAYADCFFNARGNRDACLQDTNQLFACYQRVPYCDSPSGGPFDAERYRRDCGRFIAAGILGDCRCACPLDERWGGCPRFFETGRMDECGDCAYASCARGGDPRCSCQGGGGAETSKNANQCDLCKWLNAADAVTKFRRTHGCEKNFTQEIDGCSMQRDECERRCVEVP